MVDTVEIAIAAIPVVGFAFAYIFDVINDPTYVYNPKKISYFLCRYYLYVKMPFLCVGVELWNFLNKNLNYPKKKKGLPAKSELFEKLTRNQKKLFLHLFQFISSNDGFVPHKFAECIPDTISVLEQFIGPLYKTVNIICKNDDRKNKIVLDNRINSLTYKYLLLTDTSRLIISDILATYYNLNNTNNNTIDLTNYYKYYYVNFIPIQSFIKQINPKLLIKIKTDKICFCTKKCRC